MNDSKLNAEDFLARAPLFARLGRRSLRKLAELCVPRDFESGSVIISEGDTGLGLFVIVSGRVEIIKASGDDTLHLAEMKPGDLLGEMALIDDQPRSASAIAMEPTRCLLITRSSFQNLTENDPEIAWCLLPTLAERIRDLQQRMIDFGAVHPPTKEAGHPTSSSPPASPLDRLAADDDETDLLLSLLRGQYGLAIAGTAGLKSVTTAFERFLRELADGSKLDEAESLDEVTRELPSSLLSATSAGLDTAERIPEQLLERYRRHRGGGGRR